MKKIQNGNSEKKWAKRTFLFKKFILTKTHSIEYVMHSYSNINIKNKIFIETNFNQTQWDKIEFRKEYINWFFDIHPNASEKECLTYIN